MNETRFDEWVKLRSERYNNEPAWQRAVGNFGFGFIFLGALANLLIFMVSITTKLGSEVIYHPWWLTYLVVGALAGLYWASRGHRQSRR